MKVEFGAVKKVGENIDLNSDTKRIVYHVTGDFVITASVYDCDTIQINRYAIKSNKIDHCGTIDVEQIRDIEEIRLSLNGSNDRSNAKVVITPLLIDGWEITDVVLLVFEKNIKNDQGEGMKA